MEAPLLNHEIQPPLHDHNVDESSKIRKLKKNIKDKPVKVLQTSPYCDLPNSNGDLAQSGNLQRKRKFVSGEATLIYQDYPKQTENSDSNTQGQVMSKNQLKKLKKQMKRDALKSSSQSGKDSGLAVPLIQNKFDVGGNSSCMESLVYPPGHSDKIVPNKKKKKVIIPKLTCDLDLLFSNNGNRPGGSCLNMKDLRALIMNMIHGEIRQYTPMNWCSFVNWQCIKQTVIILVPGISKEEYRSVESNSFKHLISNCGMPLPIKLDGSDNTIKSPIEGLLRYNLSKTMIKRKKDEIHQQAMDILSYGRAHMLLDESQLESNQFPDWKEEMIDGHVSTRTNGVKLIANNNSRMYAIDCEMCNTLDGRALTRVSLVGENKEVIYDELVKPNAKIIDYLTQFSGMTAEKLAPVTTRLKDAQRNLLALIQPDDILIGHSLDFDLRALQMHHDNIIDTSVAFADQRGSRYKSSLKFLVNNHLKRDIQVSSKDGHCSIEDARACMDLINLKISRGSAFGNHVQETESIFEAASRVDKTSHLLTSAHIARQHNYVNVHACIADNDSAVVAQAKKIVHKTNLAFCHLRDFETWKKGKDGQNLDSDTKLKMFESIDNSIHGIVSSMPSNSLAIVLLSDGFLGTKIAKMQVDSSLRKTPEVRSAVKRAKDCVAFLKIVYEN